MDYDSLLKTAARTLDGAGERLVSTFPRRRYDRYDLSDVAITLFCILAAWLAASALMEFLLVRVRDAAFRLLVMGLGLPPFLLTPLELLGAVLDTALILALPLSVASVMFFAYRGGPSSPSIDEPRHRDDPGEVERIVLVRVRRQGGDLSVSALARELRVPEDAVRETVERLASRGLVTMD